MKCGDHKIFSFASRAANVDLLEAWDLRFKSFNVICSKRCSYAFDEAWILIERIALCAQTLEVKNCWRIFLSENVNEASGKHRLIRKAKKSSNKAQLESFWTFEEAGTNLLQTPWSFRRDWISFAVSALNLTCVSNDSRSISSSSSLFSPISLFRLSLHIHRTFSTAASAAIAPATTPCKENSTSLEDETDLCNVSTELHQNWQRMLLLVTN